MLNERPLLRLMKDSWKGGYHAAEYNGRFFLRGAGWQIAVQRQALPRKVLAQLVEHIGGLPDGCSFLTSKKDNSQTEILGAELEIHEEAAAELREYSVGIRPAPLYYQGYHVWQVLGSGEAILLSDPMTAIVDASKVDQVTVSKDRTRIFFSGAAGYASIGTTILGVYAEAMRHLSAFPWIGA